MISTVNKRYTHEIAFICLSPANFTEALWRQQTY